MASFSTSRPCCKIMGSSASLFERGNSQGLKSEEVNEKDFNEMNSGGFQSEEYEGEDLDH